MSIKIIDKEIGEIDKQIQSLNEKKANLEKIKSNPDQLSEFEKNQQNEITNIVNEM